MRESRKFAQRSRCRLSSELAKKYVYGKCRDMKGNVGITWDSVIIDFKAKLLTVGKKI